MAERKWRVRLGAAAELDFANIVKWTTENFGARQSRVYQETLVQAIGELTNGGLFRADNPGIVDMCRGFCERLTLWFIEVSEKYQSVRPHDRTLSRSAESPCPDTRRLLTCHGCQDA